MDRRGFFKLFSLGVAGIALEQAIPLGRVWSFPKKIVLAGIDLAVPDSEFSVLSFSVGDVISIGRDPQRYIVTSVHEQPTIIAFERLNLVIDNWNRSPQRFTKAVRSPS